MNNTVLLLFIFCLAIAGSQFIVIQYFIFTSRKQRQHSGETVGAITVLIPFRNEAQRIESLITSINEQRLNTELIELIFIDDYSTDSSKKKIEDCIHLKHKIIQNKTQQGKKFALTEGVKEARHKYVLTLDADVWFKENYFENVLQTEAADLIILPVTMTSKSIIEELAAIEFNWMQKLTFGNPSPILCNGANLLFRKQAYLDLLKTRRDFGIASGDDIFLMQSLQKSGGNIFRDNDLAKSVGSRAPEKISDLLRQRKRWSGKFKYMATAQGMALILFVISIQLMFLTSLIMTFFYPIFMIPLVIKFVGEILFGTNSPTEIRARNVIIIYIHQFWYLIYLLLLTLPMKQTGRWKNSEIIKN